MIDQIPKLIFFIGFMGSGKSHEGALLAAHLGLPFIDLDQWIEAQQGRTISAIFKDDGENVFRSIEASALHQAANDLLSQESAIHTSHKFVGVIATGGGTPCFHGNIEWMNANGVTIWLNLSVDILVNRLRQEKKKRPLIAELNDDQLYEFIEDKLKERYPYYSKSIITIHEVVDILSLTQKVIHA